MLFFFVIFEYVSNHSDLRQYPLPFKVSIRRGVSAIFLRKELILFLRDSSANSPLHILSKKVCNSMGLFGTIWMG